MKEFRPTKTRGKCQHCGNCCKSIYFKLIIREDNLKALKEYIKTKHEGVKIETFVTFSPFTEINRIEDWYKWVGYHNIKLTYLPDETKRIYAVELDKNKIEYIKKGKALNVYFVKFNIQCGRLINNKCSIYGNHPIICKEDIGSPAVQLCGYRWVNNEKKYI